MPKYTDKLPNDKPLRSLRGPIGEKDTEISVGKQYQVRFSALSGGKMMLGSNDDLGPAAQGIR